MRVEFQVTDSCVCCDSRDIDSIAGTINPFIVERITGVKNYIIPCHSMTCNNCGSMFQDIRYTDEQLARLYKDYRSEEYITTREKYFPNYHELNSFFDTQVPYMDTIEALLLPHLKLPVSILDYGGDTGINAPFAGKRVLDIYDIGSNEPIAGTRVDKLTGNYDLIMCSNVLEHVSHPELTLLDIKRFMKDDSILYVEIPIDGVSSTGWMEHLTLFTGKGLDLLFDMCGLDVIDTENVSITAAGYPVNQSLIILKMKG